MTDTRMLMTRTKIQAAKNLEEMMYVAGVNRGFTPADSRAQLNAWLRGADGAYTAAWRAAVLAELPTLD